MAASRSEAPALTREAVLRFVSEHPERSSKREIAKAFGIKGGDRVDLKNLLSDLQAEGLLSGGRKHYEKPGALPAVSILQIRRRDADGVLVAEPVKWDDDTDGPRPVIAVRNDPKARGPAAGLNDRILARIDQAADGSRSARVIRVLENRKPVVLGLFRADGTGGGRLEPVERKQSELVIREADANGAADGDLVEVEPQGRGRIGLSAARVVNVVGSIRSERAISTIALHHHDIPHVFPEPVIAEAEAVEAEPYGEREDWRDLPLVTIDPATAKDHDDAVFARDDTDPANPGGMIVTVAIADVSWYVRPGSALDREARRRGNSVYFPDRVVPMLPERISNDLCSLREKEDRPALAVAMTFGSDGEKRSHSFHRILMRSRAKLSYEAAQASEDGVVDAVDPEIAETIVKPLFAAYRLVGKARARRAPLALDMPERRLELDERGAVARVVVPPRLDAHRLIEEFMILANVAAAETLEARRQALIYRTHDAPALAKLEALREFLKSMDIPLAKAGVLRPSHFNGILAAVKDGPNDHLVSEVVLRSQSQAIYAPDNIGHFGLNLQRYAHFTSPIRRYADLIVHRALVTALGLGEGGIAPEDEETLADTAEQISQAERRAMAAERDTVDRLVAHHLADRVGQTFEGRVAGVTRAGLFVALDAYGADGFVPVSTLGADFFRFDEDRRTLVGERSGRGYRLGDTVEVELVEALPMAGALRFEMLSEPRKLPRVTGSFHKARQGKRRGRSDGRTGKAGRGR